MRWFTAALLASAALGACGKAADSIVVVHVEAEEGLAPVLQLRVGITNRGLMDTKVFAQPDGTTMMFPRTLALIVPSDKDGPVELEVAGVGQEGKVVAHGRTRGDLVRSKRIDVEVVLAGGPPGGCSQVVGSCPPSTDGAVAGPPLDAGVVGDVGASTSLDGSGRDDAASAPEVARPADLAVGDQPSGEPGRHAIGDQCSASAECVTGHCVDGFCCENACVGTCFVCDLPGKKGLCSPVPAGQDPRDGCTLGAAPCGGDGTCDGAGACRRPAAATRCAPPVCTGGQVTGESTCNGAGQCIVPPPQQCAAGCAADGVSCAAPPVKRGNGETCAGNGECVSNVCADGVCCGTDCTKNCHACNLPGRRGVCSPVPDGEDPANHCAEATGDPCGRDGFCDGTGGCRLKKAGTVCVPGTCTGATKTSTRTCDGMGTCQPGTTTSCLPATCNVSGSDCDTTCSNHPEGCPGGQLCSTLCGMPAICCRP